MEKAMVLVVVLCLLVFAVAASSESYHQVSGLNGPIDQNKLEEFSFSLGRKNLASDPVELQVNVIEFAIIMPAINRVDAAWTVTMPTPELAGFNVTWKDEDAAVVAECFVAGQQNDTYYNTLGKECEHVLLEPCSTSHVEIIPVNTAGEDIGIKEVYNSEFVVPLSDELNYACNLELTQSTDWIDVSFDVLNSNQAPVNCSITWTDVKEDKQAAECSLDCFSPSRLKLMFPGRCDPDASLEPRTLYRIDVQPFDATGPVGKAVSGTAITQGP